MDCYSNYLKVFLVSRISIENVDLNVASACMSFLFAIKYEINKQTATVT